MFKKRTDKSSEKSMDTTANTTTTTTSTTNTMKSKKFPSMFKKMMLSRLKNMSKDATSAVKSSVQKKASSKKKSTAAAAAAAAQVVATEQKADCKPMRPGTATLDKPLLVNCKRAAEPGTPEARPAPTKATVAAVKRPILQQQQQQHHQQQFNNRTYRVKTKDRKSVLSLPEVSKQSVRARKSYLPIKVKVKPPAPAPPIHRQNDTTPLQPSKISGENEKEEAKSETHEEYQPEKWIPTAVGSARKKRLVLCYLCGKEFGTASLPFHEPQCLKKWTLENSKLPEHLQRNTPQKPTDSQNMSVDDWNQLAWEATQLNLVPCDYCQRKFSANRLEAHAKVCIESKKKLPVPKLAAKSTMDKAKKKPVMCYVCGRLFGTASIGIHEPQCLAKWTRENESLAPHLRRPEPVKPETIVDEETGKVNHQATRDEHWKTYLSQLVPCDRCKRTFDPDRLEVHQRSCKGLTTNAKNT